MQKKRTGECRREGLGSREEKGWGVLGYEEEKDWGVKRRRARV